MAQSKKNGATEHFQGAYIPKQRYRWLKYDEDAGEFREASPSELQDPEDTSFKVKLRAHLTGEELEPLVWDKDTQVTAMHEMFAPFVVDWNAATLDDNDQVVQIEPPATGGARQFEAIPVALFFQIVVVVKAKSFGPVDPKRWTPSAVTHAPSSGNGTANA